MKHQAIFLPDDLPPDDKDGLRPRSGRPARHYGKHIMAAGFLLLLAASAVYLNAHQRVHCNELHQTDIAEQPINPHRDWSFKAYNVASCHGTPFFDGVGSGAQRCEDFHHSRATSFKFDGAAEWKACLYPAANCGGAAISSTGAVCADAHNSMSVQIVARSRAC